MAQRVDQGRLIGVLSACGAALGGLVLTLAATVAISTLLASSSIVFAGLRYVGAARDPGREHVYGGAESMPVISKSGAAIKGESNAAGAPAWSPALGGCRRADCSGG